METNRKRNWKGPLFGVLAAIASLVAVASLLPSEFGALSLFPLMALFCYLERFSRREMGLVVGRARHYGLALLYPLLVLSLSGLAAGIAGAINLTTTDWPATALKLATTIPILLLVSILTEEGFFRGWLVASLKRAGQNDTSVIVWTSIAFAAWHIPVAFLYPEFALPWAQVPVYILNVAIAGAIFALVRLISNSVVVASASHALWNGLAYTFFGTGAEIGLLGIEEGSIFSPEVGVLGLVLNLAFATGLWLWYRRAAMTVRGLHPIPGAQAT
jgi:membrane protease YdiL (CAAX protease family)